MAISKLTRSAGRTLSGCLLAALLAMPAASQEPSARHQISSISVAPGVYMLSGQGGNMALSVGVDGAVLIDDELALLTEELRTAIAGITTEPVRFVINTHWHFDHTGSNESLARSGAVLVAHDNVRERLRKGQAVPAFNRVFPPAPTAALPVITFADRVSFHWNGDTLEVAHAPAAHTDGDAVVYFRHANVVHLGDLYWNGIYPLVDGSSGGSTTGMIEAVAAVLARIDANTRVIPGHGPIGDTAGLQAYHDMLRTVHLRIEALRTQGKTIDEIVAAAPTAEFDAQWAGGLFNPEQWVRIVHSAP